MEEAVFNDFRQLIYDQCGIVLTAEKQGLLLTRIQKRLRKLGLQEAGEYLALVTTDQSGLELQELINAISTNTTSFYREPHHFDVLAKLLRNFASTRNEIKIWCAASSSGEEPYTLGFTALEELRTSPCSFKILATDISVPVLERAITGLYSDEAVRPIPAAIRDAYLERSATPDKVWWRVADRVRERIAFRRFNLVEFPYPLKGNIDIIFCRNVMIYFDRPTRQKIIDQFSNLLRPDGYLFLSHSENLLGIEHKFERFDNSVFIKAR